MSIMNSRIYKITILVIFIMSAASLAYGQDSAQKAMASTTAVFGTADKTKAPYTTAIDAHDLKKAESLTNKEGAFRGKVTQVFTPRSGTVAILNFDKDYKTALTAVIYKENWAKFPDLETLVGKEVVISGKFANFHGASQIALTDPARILVLK